MILMGNGGTEKGHDAIAQDLVHRALVAVNSVHHTAQGRIDELLSGFWIAIPDQLGGVLNVGEQDRHLVPFPFQAMAGIEDFLGEIRWGIREGCALRCDTR